MAQKIGAFICITRPEERGDPFEQCYQMATELFDVVTVIDGEKTWPKEFEWTLIGKHFQKGYEQTNADWVIHLDCDFFFHERDYDLIREKLGTYNSIAMSFHKRQIFTPDRYTVKSHLTLAVNKKRCGNQIKFNGGGDLCQPTIGGSYLDPKIVMPTQIPVWNYDSVLKTKEQIKEDKGRFARAWQKTFGNYKLGGPDDESAYNEWWYMIKGRYNKHRSYLELADHPKLMQETLSSLKPDQFGHSAFGLKYA